MACFQQCADGTYTSTTGASSCTTCPQGSYCLPVVLANSTDNIKDCPQGYYCPNGELCPLDKVYRDCMVVGFTTTYAISAYHN
jgi:hypothetical protein